MWNTFWYTTILCPTIEVIEKVNDFILFLVNAKEYLRSDTPCQSNEDNDIQSEWFTFEFLNDIKCSGKPNHKIKLKVDVPIMLLRNIDQANDLCNGTRLKINHLSKNVISTTVITGKTLVRRYLSQEWIWFHLIMDCRLNFKKDNFQYLYVLQW